MIAAGDQRLQGQLDRGRGPQQRVAHKGRVDAVLHPDPLLQQRVAEDVAPDRDADLQPKSLQRAVTGRRDPRLARPRAGQIGAAVAVEGEGLAAVADFLVQLGQQQGACGRRVARRLGRRHGSHHQPVIAARQRAGHRPHRVAAQSVGHQPLAGLSVGEIVACFASEIEHIQLFDRQIPCSYSYSSSYSSSYSYSYSNQERERGRVGVRVGAGSACP